MKPDAPGCQADDVHSSATTPQSKPLYWIERTRKHGLAGILKKLATLLRSQKPAVLAGSRDPGSTPAKPPEPMNLGAGDLVEVKSLEQILETLDAQGKCKGLLFMPEMREYCGKRLRVHKRVERILLENTGELRRMRNTVLLEGALCGGWNGVCDRSCFYFWRNAWLRKVE